MSYSELYEMRVSEGRRRRKRRHAHGEKDTAVIAVVDPAACPRDIRKLQDVDHVCSKPLAQPKTECERNAPKFSTSNTFALPLTSRPSAVLPPLSAPRLAQLLPSSDTPTARMGERWVRYSLTNSTPTGCFFQNLRMPSIEAVMMKLVLARAG